MQDTSTVAPKICGCTLPYEECCGRKTNPVLIPSMWVNPPVPISEDLPPWVCPACNKGNGPKTTYCRHCAGET